ncbi:hypothetical protein [Paenibacillus tyrfis]|uniref:hypothetical protein n=1 Tax=Paenibacillus tyrfis TaxID=1501230 RepID=UPI00117EDFF7|nr:hypothetical protein [Paenibacillus tyrfis]
MATSPRIRGSPLQAAGAEDRARNCSVTFGHAFLEQLLHCQRVPDEGSAAMVAARAPGIHADGAAGCQRERLIEELQLTFGRTFLVQLGASRR